MTPEQEQEVRDSIHEIRRWMERICTEFDEYREHMKRMQLWLNAHDQKHVLEEATSVLVQKNANLVKTNETLLAQMEQRRSGDAMWHNRAVSLGKAGWAVVIAILGGAGGATILRHFFPMWFP